MSQPIVEINALTTEFISRQGLLGRQVRVVRALDSVNLKVNRGETLGVVGESGCGKTTLGRSIIRLTEPISGEVIFEGTDLLRLSDADMQARRKNMQMVFQNPYSSLNPRMTIKGTIAEPITTHTDLHGQELTEKILGLLQRVGLNEDQLYRYPHEFSGGQLQRIALARAVALSPTFLILDEPTSALDVSVQAQILNLLEDFQDELNLTYMFISHDLSVVQHMSDNIAVMYLGRVVEFGASEDIFADPKHPYTAALLSSTPVVDAENKRERIILEGTVPSPADPPSGCAFHTRCPKAFAKCPKDRPELRDLGEGHLVSCFLDI